MRTASLASNVSSVVFSPTIMAYGLIVVGYVLWGIGLYLIFLGAAYKMHLFQRLRDWPISSRTALFLGVLLIGLGLYSSTQPVGYWMTIPALVYTVLSIVGGLALTESHLAVGLWYECCRCPSNNRWRGP